MGIYNQAKSKRPFTIGPHEPENTRDE
jgi:hypothetical protein